MTLAARLCWIGRMMVVAYCVIVMLGELRPLAAQARETPAPFDSAGRVRSLTPPLVARLGLRPPVWPVTGAFVEARLFSLSPRGFVIVATLPAGEVDRYSLSDTQRFELRATIDAATARFGRPVGEEQPATIFESARGAFVRNQMVLAATLYGPALATLTHDERGGSAAYLLTVGGTYFVLQAATKNRLVTKAQNSLATDGAVRGALMANGIVYASGRELSEDGAAVTTLGGALIGTVNGLGIGLRLTEAEADAATTWSTFTAATALGIAGGAGAFNDSSEGRSAVGAAVAGSALGYPIGLAYARRARYAVTSGDVSMLQIGALLGTAMAGIPLLAAEKPDPRVTSGVLTFGFLAGVVAADRGFARPFDHTSSEARQVLLGTLAGGLLGGAAVLALETDQDAVILGIVTSGALLGTLAAERLVAPKRGVLAGQLSPGEGSGGGALRRSDSRLRVSPLGLALAASGARGRHTILALSF